MKFEPVHLPEDRRLNNRVSMTFLRHYAACPRSGYLYALHKGEASTGEMQRGKALHLVHERAVRAMMDQGEPIIPPEVMKVIVDEVLAEIPVPFEEHDYVREMSYRLATEMAIDLEAVIACETLFVLEAGGYQVRGRVDFAEILEGGAVLHVEDLKTSRAAPPFEEVARKRADGTLMAKNLQLVVYALQLVYGVPVRVEIADGEAVETVEPFSVAGRAQRADLAFVFPGLEGSDGRMVRRPMTLTRAELDQYRGSLDGLLARVRNSEETGDWPAVVSNDGCRQCPCSAKCPIPRELRDGRGEIRTPEDAEQTADLLTYMKDEVKVLGKLLREYVKESGPVRYGLERVAEIGHETAEKITDRDAMFAAMERAVAYGEPFDRSEFVRPQDSFPLKLRQLTVDEIEAESEGSDGEEG